jgi:GAF domain-containing protein
MVGWTIAHQQARIALDTGDEAVRFNNPHLPKTRSEVALPLRSGDQIFGAVSVQSSKPKAFDEDDVTVLQGIADSLATALNNARLFQQEEKNLEEIRSLNRQYVQDAWTKAAARPGLNSYIYSSDTESELIDTSLATNLAIVLRDQVIGQISLELSSPDLTAEDRAFAEQITNQAALAMENVRLLEETQRRANHERLVSDIVKKARASADVDTIIRTTLEELGKSMKAVEGIIHLGAAEKMAVSKTQRSEQ